jgi:hypothetical protein
MKIVPADSTIEELSRKASECEEQAKSESNPTTKRLGEIAVLCHEWIAKLKSGKWMS